MVPPSTERRGTVRRSEATDGGTDMVEKEYQVGSEATGLVRLNVKQQ